MTKPTTQITDFPAGSRVRRSSSKATVGVVVAHRPAWADKPDRLKVEWLRGPQSVSCSLIDADSVVAVAS